MTVEQCLLFFYGAGRNGKSTLVDLMVDVLGDYAVSLSIDSFAGDSRKVGGEATPDLARLPGARMVSASEPEMGVRLKDALIKTLTGGDKISVRRLHQDFFELIPQFKIVLQGNHKPIITDDSDGIWRRVMLIFFEIQVPKEQVDPELPKRLRREAAGVFAWMVAGALDYLTMGLRPPEKVLAATEEYRQESDPLGAFIRGACMVTGREDDSETPENMHIGYGAGMLNSLLVGNPSVLIEGGHFVMQIMRHETFDPAPAPNDDVVSVTAGLLQENVVTALFHSPVDDRQGRDILLQIV